MKKYSSKRAKKGKLAYRTPDRFIYRAYKKTERVKARKRNRFGSS